jgi:hypothetical protein
MKGGRGGIVHGGPPHALRAAPRAARGLASQRHASARHPAPPPPPPPPGSQEAERVTKMAADKSVSPAKREVFECERPSPPSAWPRAGRRLPRTRAPARCPPEGVGPPAGLTDSMRARAHPRAAPPPAGKLNILSSFGAKVDKKTEL